MKYLNGFSSDDKVCLVYKDKEGNKKLKKIDEKLLEEAKKVVLHDELSQKHFDYFSKIKLL